MYCQVVCVSIVSNPLLLQACRAGHSAACMAGGDWTRLCGSPRQPCPPILTLVEPKARESGLYRCHITFDSSVIMLNVYMLQFTGEFNGCFQWINSSCWNRYFTFEFSWAKYNTVFVGYLFFILSKNKTVHDIFKTKGSKAFIYLFHYNVLTFLWAIARVEN